MPMKIFELAKELGVGAIDLVERLKAEGFAVRNHMATLSDEEVVKAKALYAPVEEEPKKKTKKKVTKKKSTKKTTKKTTKKVVRRRAASATEESSAEEVKEEKKKEGSPKIVVRRKKKESSEAELTESANETSSVAEMQDTTETLEKSETTAETVSDSTEERSVGLKVVSRPEPVDTPEQEESVKDEEDEFIDDRPKMHRFTPVYIPEKSPEKEKEESSASKPVDKSSPAKVAEDGKKRVSNLAAMMSRGRATSKSRDIVQMRADEELKQYALNSLGRPLYTNIGRKKTYTGPSAKTKITEVKDSKRVITMEGAITALDLAKKLKIKFKELRDKCLDLNLLIKQEDYFGEKLASEIAALYKYSVKNHAFKESEILEEEKKEDKSNLPLRDPVITIMGHVDHGKTTLLDYIRNTKVAAGEAGGITQHIGAYKVEKNGQEICFLDTPGHAAFGAMRQRGANVTDIVVLVVAADDGVMPQTKESIKFCQNADVPIIVAVNKCDKEDAKPDRVKQELIEFDLTPEEWGGDTMYCNISALKGDGVDELLEQILLLAEMLDLREDPKGKASGVVIEAQVEQGRGPVATMLVQKGTIKKGDSIVVGETYGRARSILDHKGDELKSAGPSTPIRIFGLAGTPVPGDQFHVVKNEREAKKIAENRIKERKELESIPVKKKMSLEDFFGSAAEGNEKKILNVIVRSDVQGSYEAIKSSLESLGNDEVGVKVIGGGVGAITDNDVNLAASSSAVIFGFNMRPVTSARRLAEERGVDVKTYSVIYELINDVKLALEGLLEPEFTEKFIGRAEVRETFVIPKVGTIAGTIVVDGKIERGCNIRLLREGQILHDGKLNSLKRFKDDVKEVANGYECGMGLEGYNDIKVGDIFEAYILEEKKRKLDNLENETL